MFIGFKVFKVLKMFLGFWGFLYEDWTRKYDAKAHEKHPIYIILKTNLHSERRMKNTMWNLKNEDEIDESHKSQLKFEYNVYLL